MGGVLSWKEGVFAKLNIQLPCQDGKLKRSMGLRGPDSQGQERWSSEGCHQVRALGVGLSLGRRDGAQRVSPGEGSGCGALLGVAKMF